MRTLFGEALRDEIKNGWVRSGVIASKPGGVLEEFLGGDVPLGPWNP